MENNHFPSQGLGMYKTWYVLLGPKSLSVSYKGFSDQVAATGVTSTSMSQALTDGKL